MANEVGGEGGRRRGLFRPSALDVLRPLCCLATYCFVVGVASLVVGVVLDEGIVDFVVGGMVWDLSPGFDETCRFGIHLMHISMSCAKRSCNYIGWRGRGLPPRSAGTLFPLMFDLWRR